MPLFALLTMIVAQALFKTAYEVVVYPVTRKVIQNVKFVKCGSKIGRYGTLQ